MFIKKYSPENLRHRWFAKRQPCEIDRQHLLRKYVYAND